MTQRTILDVDWIVLEETTPPPADEPLTISAQPSAAPEPVVIASRSGEAISPATAIRPWAKPLLISTLVLSVLWLAAMMITIADGALFADPAVHLALVLTGFPIICILAVAFLADPDHESNDETYWTLGSYPVGPCTPTRANTFTGSDHRR